jgi:drug/metabolite transporter (DMT)-like permease
LRKRDEYNQHLIGIVLSSAGIILLSFDTVLIRLSAVPAWDVAFWRGFLIFASVSLLLFLREKTTFVSRIKSQGLPLVVSGLLWGSTGVLFVISVKLTIAANVLVMMSLSPLYAAIFSYFLLKEKIRRGSFLMIILAVLGIYIIFSGKIEIGNILGDILALFIPVSLGFNLVWMRRFRGISMPSAVIIGGLVAAVISLPFINPLAIPLKSFIYLALLGLGAIPAAQLLIAAGTGFIPASETALIMMLESVIGPFWVWIFMGEVPPGRTFIGGAILLTGVFANSVFSIVRERGKNSALREKL